MAMVLLLMEFANPSFSQSLKGQEKAPDFILKSLRGKSVRLSRYKGKVVLLNFWATWCAPCKAEMPEMVNWQAQYKNRGMEIIGITYPPYKIRNVRQLIKKLRINYPIVLANRKLAQTYAIGEILPVTMVIDRQGNLVERILGIMAAEEFEQKVKPFLQ
jgi:cytochrome c biogenesis protein CcmG/thiol:disulfide interchange protein DsbE